MMIFSIVLATMVAAPGGGRCSVGELRHNNNGYQYTEARIRQFIDSAEVIVLVRAAGHSPSAGAHASSRIKFEVLDRIKAPDSLHQIELLGDVVDRDDFSRLVVPYGLVRPSGQRGDCHAREYRIGAQYLLILGPMSGALTPHWKPLAPFNEQVLGPDDLWVTWVRQVARSR